MLWGKTIYTLRQSTNESELSVLLCHSAMRPFAPLGRLWAPPVLEEALRLIWIGTQTREGYNAFHKCLWRKLRFFYSWRAYPHIKPLAQSVGSWNMIQPTMLYLVQGDSRGQCQNSRYKGCRSFHYSSQTVAWWVKTSTRGILESQTSFSYLIEQHKLALLL